MRNKQKTLIGAAAMQGLMLGFWSAGWLCWICENVGLSPDFRILLAAALIFCLIFEIAHVLKKLRITIPAAAGILAVAIYVNRTEVFSGLNAWLEGLSEAVHNYYQVELSLAAGPIEAAENMTFYVLVLGILVITVGYAVSIWRLKRVPLYFTGLALVMSLILDSFPDIGMMVLTAVCCGGLTAFMSVRPLERGRILNKNAVINSAFALALMALVFGLSYGIANNFAAEYMRSHYETVKTYPQKMMAASEKVLSVFLGDREWQLSNHSPVQSGRTKLKIWTDKKPEAALYLKGFAGVGFNTQTEQWNVFTDEGLKKDYQNWSVSDSLTYDEAKALWAKQLYDCLDRLDDGTGAVNYIISNVSAGKESTWAPYGIDTDGLEMEGDSYLKASSDSEFQGYPLADMTELLTYASDSDVTAGDKADLFQSYNQYVRANYLNVPDGLPSLEAAVREIQDESGDLSTSQWVAQIQNVLWKTCSYEKNNLESVPDGSNVIEDFFGRQKKGYCTHFASAGVMMLRMAGVPARYVTGYVVWPDDFQADSVSNGYTADVTGYRGHAWVEVYNASQGIWVPVDMTPSDSVRAANYPPTQENGGNSESDNNSVNNQTDSTETFSNNGDSNNETDSTEAVSDNGDISNEMDSTEDVSDNGDISNETDSTETVSDNSDNHHSDKDTLTGNKGDGSGTKSGISETNTGIPAAVKIVMGMALVMVIVGLGMYVYRRRQNQTLHYSRVNRNKALLAMWAHLTDELNRSGIRPEKEMDDWAYIEWLQSRMHTVTADELAFLMEKLHQAAFSEEMLTEETYEQCVQICHRIKEETEKKGLQK